MQDIDIVDIDSEEGGGDGGGGGGGGGTGGSITFGNGIWTGGGSGDLPGDWPVLAAP